MVLDVYHRYNPMTSGVFKYPFGKQTIKNGVRISKMMMNPTDKDDHLIDTFRGVLATFKHNH